MFGVAVDIQAFVGQVADSRGEAKAQQVHQCKQVIGEPRRIGVVLLDTQV